MISRCGVRIDRVGWLLWCAAVCNIVDDVAANEHDNNKRPTTTEAHRSGLQSIRKWVYYKYVLVYRLSFAHATKQSKRILLVYASVCGQFGRRRCPLFSFSRWHFFVFVLFYYIWEHLRSPRMLSARCQQSTAMFYCKNLYRFRSRWNVINARSSHI